jgi:hypothetical protein
MPRQSETKIGTFGTQEHPKHIYVNKRKHAKNKIKARKDGHVEMEVPVDTLNQDFFERTTMDYYRNIVDRSKKGMPINIMGTWKEFLEFYEAEFLHRVGPMKDSLKKDLQANRLPIGNITFFFYLGTKEHIRHPSEEEQQEWHALWDDEGRFQKLAEAQHVIANPQLIWSMDLTTPVLACAYLVPAKEFLDA